MPSEGGGKPITKNDAVAYLRAVKDVFHNKTEKYDYFLKFMKDYKEQRIDYEDVIARVKGLFKEHTDLISGFNFFLPHEYQIKLQSEDDEFQSKSGGYEEATDFVEKIKPRFQGNDHVYSSFLNIMNMLGEGQKSMTEAYQEVVALLQANVDLLQELTHIFPSSGVSSSTALLEI
ncbi:hypothetical protein RJT34_01907 [Clitoria ternatea]|uniref:Uncharacterized protein n=1 Tax=Clitoria ternatea TaxID=43366 RepID=A0AAN9KHI9_CLITE